MSSAVWVVIPSAGKGTRFGAAVPKQYLSILEKTVLEHTLDRFLCRKDVCGIVLAVSAEDFKKHDIYAGDDRVMIVEGGADRAASVYNALVFLQQYVAADDLVAVHDAARPCVRQSSLDQVFAAAVKHSAGAILAASATDTVKWSAGRLIEKTLPRERIFLAQTPQVFRYQLLMDAMHHARLCGYDMTDEASAIEYSGHKPAIISGRKDNIKITVADDLALAAFFLERIRGEGD